jgi:hypothetical protein
MPTRSNFALNLLSIVATQDRFLVLDLNTEAGPTFQMYPSTTRWLWNALLVYGGRRGVYGSIDTVTTSPYTDLAKNANMVGLGITPEAIDQDMRDFDAFWEAAWRSAAPNTTSWLQNYAVRRYGAQSPSVSAAYYILQEAAFNSGIDTAVLETRPGLGSRMTQGTDATGILNVRRQQRAMVRYIRYFIGCDMFPFVSRSLPPGDSSYA